MGRPPLDRKAVNTTRMLVTITKDTRKRIKAALNKAERETESSFIRKTIETELKKRERKK